MKTSPTRVMPKPGLLLVDVPGPWLALTFIVSVAVCFLALPFNKQALAAAPDISPNRLMSLPLQEGPVDVLFDFDVYDINDIDSVAETFQLSGVMRLSWRDKRLAFDPETAGVDEMLFQGEHQVHEIASHWYPQVVLVNESGSYSKSGVQLRIRSDGTSILTEKITADVETDLNMRSFPLDSHTLKARFMVLGHNRDDVVFKLHSTAEHYPIDQIHISGWSLKGIELAIEAMQNHPWETVVLAISVSREANYVRRLITLPMLVIVLLSFSIFWMDKSSLADRNSISFIGVLTGVAFQHIVINVIPPVSYITLMNAFLFISFFTMAATVPVNFLVAEMDKRGKYALGDRIDRRCRWLFPLTYFGCSAAILLVILMRDV